MDVPFEVSHFFCSSGGNFFPFSARYHSTQVIRVRSGCIAKGGLNHHFCGAVFHYFVPSDYKVKVLGCLSCGKVSLHGLLVRHYTIDFLGQNW